MKNLIHSKSLQLSLLLIFALAGSIHAATFPIVGSFDGPIRDGQKVTTTIRLSENGMLDGVMHMENDVLIWDPGSGMCATSLIGLVDSNGNILERFTIPQSCLDGKWWGKATVRDVPWASHIGSPETLKKAANVKVQTINTPGDPIAWEEFKKLFGLK